MYKPWENEPDELQFEAHGFKCLLKRGPMKHWCGYVGVSNTHPLYNHEYNVPTDVLKAILEQRLQQPLGENPSFSIITTLAFGGELKPRPEDVFLVHGGITYSDNHCESMDKSLWYFGFDCAHCDDLTPKDAESDRQYGTYRTMEYAKAEAERLAEQLAKLQPAEVA